MNANEIRQKFLEFEESKGHKVIQPAPLVLECDPTTLCTGSGMQPLLPYLLGKKHPLGTRLCDSQPSMRLQDIEDVGDPRHTTVFEMLGNWSLGDYFKEEQIRNFFEFLTKVVGLDPSKIYVTCFIGNEKYGIPIAEIGSASDGDKRGIQPGERIFFYDDHENWWSRGGGCETTPIGDPCGPDSEVFYDFGEDKQDVKKYGLSHPASDGARFMEIGNQVFMQYRRNEDGTFSELEKKNVDFGGGLERIAAAAIGSFDVFKISLMQPIIAKLEKISGKSYDNNTDEMRVIADHIRGAYLLAAQGLVPSNKTQGYAMRRLVRRAILRALDLGIASDFLAEIVPIVANNYVDLPDAILTHREIALDVLLKEEKAFRKTLNNGIRELRKITKNNKIIDGKDIFKLQDTYGFPMELSVEECYREGIVLSENYRTEFEDALKEQRERSQTASKGMFKGGLEDHGEQTVKYHTSCHLLLAALQKLVSSDICQKGSNITAERVRFDFNLDHKMTPEELAKVEKQVNEWISADLPVVYDEYDKAYARDTLKAHGSFFREGPPQAVLFRKPPEGHCSAEKQGLPCRWKVKAPFADSGQSRSYRRD